ncbi:metalloproteinase inhibitor 2-like [Porites lutea]|uniref:metalloproteinase inhibitor 2-like n=1 Tax=Porites lutea TaxID=51062 RepID=UPI003CC553DB
MFGNVNEILYCMKLDCDCSVQLRHQMFQAIKAKVLNETVDDNSRIYKLKILKFFKGASEISRSNGTRMVLAYTGLNSPVFCGTYLRRSKTYLLLGYLDRENKLRFGLCHWHQLWEDITRQQRRGLKRLYGRNCDCRVDKCLGPETCDDMIIDGCNVPDSDWNMTFCKKKHSFCEKNKSGNSCRWVKKSPAFKKCLCILRLNWRTTILFLIWADVTPRQCMGIRRFYGDNCDCQISPCYAESCKKLQGCRKSGNFYDSDCEWRHSYCLVNADKSACAWHETEEYNKCMNKLVIP